MSIPTDLPPGFDPLEPSTWHPTNGRVVDALRGAAPMLGVPLGTFLAPAAEHMARILFPRPAGQQTTLVVDDCPKMLRETLCVAQAALAFTEDLGRLHHHRARLQALIDECDRHRPLGPDGKHGNRHTPTCGCEDSA